MVRSAGPGMLPIGGQVMVERKPVVGRGWEELIRQLQMSGSSWSRHEHRALRGRALALLEGRAWEA